MYTHTHTHTRKISLFFREYSGRQIILTLVFMFGVFFNIKSQGITDGANVRGGSSAGSDASAKLRECSKNSITPWKYDTDPSQVFLYPHTGSVEKEVESAGVPVGEMTKILLQKIEELVLYNNELRKEVKELRKEVERLRKEGNSDVKN